MITQVDVDNFLLSYNETKNTLNSAKNQYELGKESLKIMLGQTEDVNVILPEIETKELIVEDIEKLISENIDKNKTFSESLINNTPKLITSIKTLNAFGIKLQDVRLSINKFSFNLVL